MCQVRAQLGWIGMSDPRIDCFCQEEDQRSHEEALGQAHPRRDRDRCGVNVDETRSCRGAGGVDTRAGHVSANVRRSLSATRTFTATRVLGRDLGVMPVLEAILGALERAFSPHLLQPAHLLIVDRPPFVVRRVRWKIRLVRIRVPYL